MARAAAELHPVEGETRRRLLEASAELFAERGFERVTVRDICRATSANVAAVNYYFRTKMGLYTEVFRHAIEVMRETNDLAMGGGEGEPAEERLRRFIRVMVDRVVGRWDQSWIQRLISREMADPTPALDLVVEEVLLPRIRYLSELVAELAGLAVTDERVTRCAATIQGQLAVYAPGKVRARLVPGWRPTPSEVDKLTAHITEFSLAGIRAVGRCRAPSP